MRIARPLLLAALSILCGRHALAASLDPSLLKGLIAEESADRAEAIRTLTLAAGPDAAGVLQAMADDRLQVAGDRLFITDGYRLLDAATGAPVAAAPEGVEPVTINNRVRRKFMLYKNVMIKFLKNF